MTNLTAKKIVAATASLVIAAGVVAGAVALNTSGSNSTPETTGVVNVNGYAADGDVAIDSTATGYDLPIVEKDSDLAKTLIYGSTSVDPDDYFFGTASFFTIFGKDVTVVHGADTEGRIAAQTLKNDTGSTGYYAKNQMNSQNALSGAAAVICENDADTVLQWSAAHGYVVLSDEVTELGTEHKNALNKANATDVVYVSDKDNFIIDFDAEMQMLKEKSAKLATLPANFGTVETVTSGSSTATTITGTDSQLNVFTFTTEEWEEIAQSEIKLVVPEGSYVVINVPGKNPTVLQKELNYNGNQVGNNSNTNSNVVFNFYEAETVSTNEIYRGVIFAPNAAISGGAGHNRSQLIGETITIDAEQGYWSFSMPTEYYNNYVEKYGETVEDYYVAHFYYWDYETLSYKELIDEEIYVPGSVTDLRNAYKMGDTLDVLTGDDIAAASGLDVYADADVYWEYFVDIDHTYGTGESVAEDIGSETFISNIPTLLDINVNDVTVDDSYLIKYSGANAGETFTFPDVSGTGTSSNIYFVVDIDSIRTDVTVDVEVHYADDNDADGERGEVAYTTSATESLLDRFGYTSMDVISSEEEEVFGYSEIVDITNTEVSLDTGLPVFDDEGKVIDYLSQFDGSDLEYEIPNGYIEYREADTDLTDGKAVIYLYNNTVVYDVVVEVESDYPQNFSEVTAKLYADGMVVGSTTLYNDGQSDLFNDMAIFDPEYGTEIFYELEAELNDPNFTIKEITFDEDTNTYTIKVVDNYVDAYVKVVYNDNNNNSGRTAVDVLMGVMQADGNAAPQTNVSTNNMNGNETKSVLIANDIAGGSYDSSDLEIFSVPEGYRVESITAETITQDNTYFGNNPLNKGDIAYTVVLSLNLYDLRFHDANGDLLSGFDHMLDKAAGSTTNLPHINLNNYNNTYKTVWYDPIKNVYYPVNSNFTYPAADTDLYAVVLKNETSTPRVHFNIISFSGKHYIPGNKVAQRMAYDQTTSDFTLIGIDSLGALAADTEGKYFMVSMVLGVDNDAVASTKFTISTESLTSKTYIYEDTVSHSADNSNLVEKFCAFGIHSSGLSGTSLLGEDSFLKDYDGYRQVRMVLPAEAFENEKLYINAYYYDENGQEYLHGNYVLNMNSNDFWTLKK